MNISKVAKSLAAAGLLAVTVGHAQAAPCVVALSNTNPDASLTSATACDLATPAGGNHSTANTQAAVNADNPGGLGLTWTFIDRDDSNGVVDGAFAITGAGTGSGTWLINDDATSHNRFVVTLKDGSPLQNDFLWFLIDTSVGANTCTSAQLNAGWDLCGTWLMYGTNGTSRKEVSHMDLLGATVTSTREIQQIPEPSTVALLGLGLLGATLGRKRV
jgi:PEP-CTERM motif